MENLLRKRLKFQNQIDPPKDNETPLELTQTSIEVIHTPNKPLTEEVYIPKESFWKFGSVARDIECLRVARMRSITEIQKSIIAHSNGPFDAQAEECATRSTLESNARSVEGLMSKNFPDEGKERRIEVITIDSDDEEDGGMSNDKSLLVTNPVGSYGKLLAENLLKKLKEDERLKNGNCGISMNNCKGKEVAATVLSNVSQP